MIDANNLRKGVVFELDDHLYKVVEYTHKKPGRGLATIKVKALDLRTGANIEKSFSSSERVQDVRLDYHQVEYLYNDGQFYYFMDLETYEQPAIPTDVLGETVNYLTENLQVKLTFFENEPLDIDLPTSVDLEVVEALPAVRGDTATGVSKMVTTETGLKVQTPAFVEKGTVIRVDTRTGEYITRVN
jgi:elongation factor P